MEPTHSRNPLFTIAAIAVILFSGVGIATMMGWIPNSHSTVADNGIATPLAAVGTEPAAVPAAATTPAEQPAMPATSPSATAQPPHHHHKAPTHVVEAGVPPPADAGAAVPPPGTAPQAALAPAQVAVASPCDSCGTVQSVRQVEHTPQGSGLGAVAGGVLGAVVGHQVGQGNGNALATLIGAGGGALAGNTVEKNMKRSISWKVDVAMADGSSRSFNFHSQPNFAAGDHVRVSNGQLVSASN